MYDPTGDRPRVIVIGGGIAGLATAFFLRSYGREAGVEPEVEIYEADESAGGTTRTSIEEGYTCEWGPNGFLDNEPATLELVERAGLTSELVRADEASANRYIYHSGQMRQVPTKPPAFLKSNILPLGAKLRIALEPLVPAKRNGPEESVHSFGTRRLGSTFANLMLDPMVSGIFAGNTHNLSLEAVFPKMVAMERDYGGLFRAMIAKQREARKKGTTAGGPSGPNAVLHTFLNGMGTLTDTLASSFEGSLHMGRLVQRVETNPDGSFLVRGDGWQTTGDAVILAAPSWATAEIIFDLDREVSGAIGDIWHAPVDVVCHGYHQRDLGHPLNGFGVLIPRSEGVRALGSLWSDAIFPGQAPENHRLLRTILGGAHDAGISELDEKQLHATADEAHRRVMDVRGEPSYRKAFRHARGIAQYTLGHQERVAKSESLEQELPGLYFTGASYRGVSVNGCAKDAKRIAQSILKIGEAV
ncbi:protoporphyrinogen oxidase [bacterium]|nr:protoporphyrinogen oxidase [bacterium]